MVHVISPCDKHGDNKGDSGIPSSNSVDRGGNFILQDCASHGLPVMADWGGRERGPGCEAAGNRSRKHVRWQGLCESSPVRSCPQSCIIQWTGFEGRWGGSMGGSSGRWRTTGMVGRQAGLLFSPVFDWLSCETCKCAIDEKVQVYPTGTGYIYRLQVFIQATGTRAELHLRAFIRVDCWLRSRDRSLARENCSVHFRLWLICQKWIESYM